ncbi:hypothetical protein ACHAQH_002706 [Verticillium albo-atrum]
MNRMDDKERAFWSGIQKSMDAQDKKRKTDDDQPKGDDTESPFLPEPKRSRTDFTPGWNPSFRAKPAKIIVTVPPAQAPDTSRTVRNAPENQTPAEVSPSLPTPSEIKMAHIKKGYTSAEKDTATLAVNILNIVSLVQRMNKFQPGSESRYQVLGYIINRLNNLDICAIDERMAYLTTNEAAAERKAVRARIKAAERSKRTLFNLKSEQMYVDGLRKLVNDPERYRLDVARRCERIFIHRKYSWVFAEWLRALDRFARLERRYFHVVDQEPKKTMDGNQVVWAV